jgi:hypothetical protein
MLSVLINYLMVLQRIWTSLAVKISVLHRQMQQQKIISFLPELLRIANCRSWSFNEFRVILQYDHTIRRRVMDGGLKCVPTCE